MSHRLSAEILQKLVKDDHQTEQYKNIGINRDVHPFDFKVAISGAKCWG